MSDVTTNAFRRVITDRDFVGKSLIASTFCAVGAALLLGAVVLAAGGVAELLTSASGPTLGLQPANSESTGSLLSKFSLFHNGSSALTMLAIMVAVSFCVRILLRSIARKLINNQVSGSVNRLRERIQRHALRSNPGDLTGARKDVATRLFQSSAQQLHDSGRRWGFLRLTLACDILMLLVVIGFVQWRVGLECLIPIIVCWVVGRIEAERQEASVTLLQEQTDRGLQALTRDLNKSRIVAGYGMESLEHDHFSRNLDRYEKRYNEFRRQQQQRGWTSSMIWTIAILLPAYLLARHTLFGSLIDFPQAIMLASALGMFIVCLLRWQQLPDHLGSATVAAEEISRYLLTVPPVSQTVGAKFLEPMSRILQFDQVSVETEDHPELLAGLDLKIEANQRVALLALNEAESATLVSLIPRFCDPTSGQVLIDGQDIRRVTLESLRAEAVIVGDDDGLFSATVLENVTAGQNDFSRQDAIEACKIAHADAFIRQLPGGYEAQLGRDGVRLNPGQTFRLSLARAIARNPALLIIQEPSVSLNAETKAMLDDTYERICSGRTVIFLPTRLSTVKKCERVIVLNNGRVAVDGPHDELVRKSEVYRHWEYVRFNEFRGEA